MKKAITLLLTLLFFLGIGKAPLNALTTETQPTYTYNNGGVYLDKSTVPQGDVAIGSTGQIRPLQDSLIKDTQYAFSYQVSNPLVLSIDERGNWHALTKGRVTISIRPTSKGTSDAFEAELDALGISRSPIEPTISYAPQTFTVEVMDDALIQVKRLYNPGLKTHLYTTDDSEVNTLTTRGWNFEGTAWSTRSITGDPIYRLYHAGIKFHLYTKDAEEYRVLAGRGWQQEGIAYRSSGNTPVYRLYHKGIKKHLFTTDISEKDFLSTRGWQYEGIAWYVE